MKYITLVILMVVASGCGTSKTSRDFRMEIDTVRTVDESKKQWLDSLAWVSLKEYFRMTWTQEIYVPVMDSTGRVTGSVLAEKNSVASSAEQQTERVSAVEKKDEETVNTSAGGKTQLVDVVDKEKKTDWTVPCGLYFFVFIVLLIIWFWRRPE